MLLTRHRWHYHISTGIRFSHKDCNKKSKHKITKENKFSYKYSETVLLPKSDFPVNHSRSLEVNNDISMTNFGKLVERTAYHSKERFVLHDGPPYANGSLHFGHAINKFIKDMICRRKLLEGYEVSFIPGWDCHGLPIELKAISQDMDISDPIEIRRKAKQLALDVIDEHKRCFQSWKIMADWDNSYFTFDSKYITNQLKAFSTLLDNNIIFRCYSPVYWSPTGSTALAEAELQYNEKHVSKSVFVKLKLTRLADCIKQFNPIFAIIWTTTPWTLPANQAIAYSSKIDYCVITIDGKSGEYFLIAKDLIHELEKDLNSKINIKKTINGSDLKWCFYLNIISKSNEDLPFLDSSHVTTTKGTGLVHIAPNHGLDDYKLIIKNNIPVKECIVDEKGHYIYTSNSLLENKFVLNEGNDCIIEMLGNSLLLQKDFIHSYPYDWRFNEPVIVRASPQWFINIDVIRDDCIKVLNNVKFYPESYKEYLIDQLNIRPNWCISRQRSWGVPIPVFYNKDDKNFKNPLINRQILDHIIKVFEDKGCDIWWLSSIDQLVPKHLIESELKVPVNDLRKGNDIFDIWFDSGNSWNSVLKDPKIADIYLEGYDQLRGWFQSSLILSVALRSCSPFKSIKIHGFALDSDGKKMSKSIGNVIDPNDIIEKCSKSDNNCGSDGFRWWTAKHASDHKDERIVMKSFDETLHTLNDIRRIIRFLIGSLNDFDVTKDEDVCQLSDMNILDKYMLHLLHHYINEVNICYNNYHFTSLINSSLEFMVSQVSRFYFMRIKNRLYCEHKTSLRRRTCQTVLKYIYNNLVFQLAPILPHIMIEANKHLPINYQFICNNNEWNQQNIEEDIQLVLSMTQIINKHLFGKNMLKYDCNCRLPQKDGMTLSGCLNGINYDLLITSANNYLCDRCRRYTANKPNDACDYCLNVISMSQ
ncbi:isoleucine--tRNA ligase, mitochondrial-like [Oppia nitens]|uniref:isoleucine--tRNA ligase, mitochondrial-like n=1 Tax=Oppia nitens TaxID=1686743 RepID=UPI0023D9EB7F|nr:isoleucine--tRNA ligase, mitochondrial-like [Oppia nitens]